MNTDAKSIKETIEAGAGAARKAVVDAAEMTSKTARNVASEVSATAVETATMVRDTAVERMDDARDALSESGDRLAETLRRAAEQPDAGSMQSRILSSVADGVSSVAGTLRERSVSEIAADVQAMARRNPGLFAAGAAIAGFALARFLRSSARHDHDGYRSGDGSIGQASYQSGRFPNEGRS